ncbi:MAG: ribbon-helix-helix protein, CopG family [Nitrospirae bacterium]|nr:ribbon-helix-helix protein, CopG family [Nitrospirota bacterium]
MKAEHLKKILTGKSKTISLRINPDLLRLLDEALARDKEFNNRNELIEVLILRYLESRGKL